jgi:hypothetical protein
MTITVVRFKKCSIDRVEIEFIIQLYMKTIIDENPFAIELNIS